MLEFFSEAHEYRWQGRPVKSVTQIIEWVQPFYKTPAGERAAEFGSHLHEAIRLTELGQLAWADPAMQEYLEAYNVFIASIPNCIVAEMPGTGKVVEISMYSKLYDYAGTIDQLRVYNDKVAFHVFDWKSGQPSDKWDIQMAAYVQLVREWFNIPSNIPVLRSPVRITDKFAFACPSKNTWEADFNKFLRYKADYERTKPDACL